MKVVINSCYGGFSVSLEAARHMAAAGSERAKKTVAEHEAKLARFEQYKRDGVIKGTEDDKERKFETSRFDINIKYGSLPDFHGYGYVDGIDGGFERNDPLLVGAVEALGKNASGQHANLTVVEIPDDVKWTISEYDGIEHIAEEHRTWS